MNHNGNHGIYILGAARTPIGKMMGGLASITAPELGATAIKAAIDRSGVEPQAVDEVILGQVVQAGVGQAPARQASIAAGIPTSANATTLNKVCASGLEAINQAAHAVRAGDSTVVVAGGMESMSQGPHLLPKARFGYRMGQVTLQDAVIFDGLWSPWDDHHMGMSAEAIAEKRGISRQEQDEYSLRSHQKALAAIAEGRFRQEIVPVEVPSGKGKITVVDTDEGPRADTTLEALGRLQPAFTPSGTVTAGNAPGFTDGAAATLVAGADSVTAHGLQPLARILGYASAATDPSWWSRCCTRCASGASRAGSPACATAAEARWRWPSSWSDEPDRSAHGVSRRVRADRRPGAVQAGGPRVRRARDPAGRPAARRS